MLNCYQKSRANYQQLIVKNALTASLVTSPSIGYALTDAELRESARQFAGWKNYEPLTPCRGWFGE